MKKYIYFFIILLVLSAGNIFCQPVNSGNGVTEYPLLPYLSPMYMTNTSCFTVDASGNKWIGTISNNLLATGMLMYDNTLWSTFSVASGNLPSDTVTSIAVDGNTIYAGTSKGIAKYMNGAWSVIDSTNSPLTTNHIVSLLFKNNVLWIGTGKGIFRYNGSVWNSFTTANSQLCSDTILAIEQSTNNQMWFGTCRGLSKYDGTNWTTYDTLNSGLKDNIISALCSDDQNKLYIGTAKKGIFRLSGNIIKHLRDEYPLVNDIYNSYYQTNPVMDYVYDIARDNTGNIYLSINKNSLGLAYMVKITTADIQAFKLGQRPRFIVPGNQDTLWFVGLAHNPPYLSLFSVILSQSEISKNHANLDINNLSISVTSSGNLFYDPFTGTNHTSIPKDSNSTSLSAGHLWMKARDVNGQNHVVAAQYGAGLSNYGENSSDYQPGPVCSDTTFYTIPAEKAKWNHVWKLTRWEVNYHRTHYNASGYVMPVDIATWPGNGSVAYGQAAKLAPYEDVNSNGTYDPQNGDYPIISGEQALYFIFNDDRMHAESFGRPLKTEVHAMMYAFNSATDTALNNSFFIHYKIINRSQLNYDSLVIATFNDIDIEYSNSNYTGTDTNLRMIYGYNSLGIGINIPFDSYAPAQGVMLMNVPMTTSRYFINSNSGPMSDPSNETSYINYLSNRWNDGSLQVYGGAGYKNSPGADSAHIFPYTFPGEPGDPNSWNEVSANNLPGDRHTLLTSGIYTLPADSSICFDVAYVYTQAYADTTGYQSVPLLKQHAQHIRNYYNANLTHNCNQIVNGVADILKPVINVQVYPNPTHNQVNLLLSGFELQKSYVLTDIQGKVIEYKNFTDNILIVNIQNFPKGVYILHVRDTDKVLTRKIVKE